MLRKAASIVPGLGQRAASAIALKYSSAVYSAALAKSPQVLNKVHAELAAVSSTIAGDKDLNTFIHNPTLSANDRKAGLSAIYSRLEATAPKKEPVSEITKNLLGVLSENGRLGETQGVIEGFNELVEQYRGELTVVVTSAAPLPRDVLSRLETALKQSQTGQKAKVLKVTNKVCCFPFFFLLGASCPADQVNPTVIGGLVVDFGDKTIDLSVQSRVTKLNTVLQRMSSSHMSRGRLTLPQNRYRAWQLRTWDD
jgi:F-type H+-transporting ATPase subunit O